jgi:tubulin---tyrosine ligase
MWSICCHLTQWSILAGWDVKVVLPSSQKSWIGRLSLYIKIQVRNCSPCIGKAYHIKEIVKGNYFYPKGDGNGELTSSSRPLKNGELVSLQVSNIISDFLISILN